MARYVLRRAIHSVILVIITVTVTFFVLHVAPGDPTARYSSPDIDPAQAERVRAQLGLDDPLVVQYGRWLWSFTRGDFGISLVEHRPVVDILAETIPRTLSLTVLAFVVQIIIGFSVGMIAATRRDTPIDRVLSLCAMIIYAFPAFYLAYLLIMVFSLGLGWLPSSGLATADVTGGWEALRDRVMHLVMPVIVLGVASAAGLARYTRGSVLDSIGEDYVRTARAKGLPEGRVVWWHALRNALPPILTVLGLSVPFLLGGAVVVEKVFAWPGMGTLAVDSFFARDYPVILATNFVAACMVILGSFIADISYKLADPRVTLSPGEKS